jgi:hypothetical protein
VKLSSAAAKKADLYLSDVYQIGTIGNGTDLSGHIISGGLRLTF